MASNDDDCIKRIIKAYLHFKGEATTAMILQHMITVNYGIRKQYSTSGLASKMNHWTKNSKSGSWFKLVPFEKNRQRWWRLE